MYMASKTNDGLSLDVVSRNLVGGLNCTEVIVPIKSGDREKFVNAANTQLRYIENIKVEGFTRYIPKAIYSNEYGVLIPDSGAPHAIMGGISYKINDFEDIIYDCSKEDFESGGIYDPNVNIGLHFTIGELDLVPSREALMLNDYTKEAIRNKSILFFNKLWRDIEEYRESIQDKEIALKDFLEVCFGEDKNRPSWNKESITSLMQISCYIFDAPIEARSLYKGLDVKAARVLLRYDLKISYAKTCSYRQRKQKNGYIVASSTLHYELNGRTDGNKKQLIIGDNTSDKYLTQIVSPTANNTSAKYYIINNKYNIEYKEKLEASEFYKASSDNADLATMFAEDMYEYFSTLFTVIDSDAIVFQKTKKTSANTSELISFKAINGYTSSYPTEPTFSIVNKSAADLASGLADCPLIIYGFSEDDALLKQIASIATALGTPCTASIPKIVVHKIARELEEFYVEGIYVKELQIMKHQILKDWYTYVYLTNHVKKLKIMNALPRFNPLASKWSVELYKFYKSADTNNRVSSNFTSALFEELDAKYFLNPGVAVKIAYITKYLQDVEFINTFAYISHDMHANAATDEIRAVEKAIAIIFNYYGKPIYGEAIKYLKEPEEIKIPDVQQATEDINENVAECITENQN